MDNLERHTVAFLILVMAIGVSLLVGILVIGAVQNPATSLIIVVVLGVLAIVVHVIAKYLPIENRYDPDEMGH